MNKKKVNRVLEIVIGTAFVLVIIYVLSVTVKVSRGVSRTIDTPGETVRLQVLNGCGVQSLAGKTADLLSDYRDEDIEVMVVDTDNFSVREVPRTFLISREKDKTAAVMLAKKLGLEASDVAYRPLDNNYRHVSVTLVLGQDYEQVLQSLEPDKEIRK